MPPRSAVRSLAGAKPPAFRRFRILDDAPGATDRVAADEAVIVCPWLRGLNGPDGLFLAALPIHDVNAWLEGASPLELPARLRPRCYVGVLALDRLRLTVQLLGRLRDKGIGNLINLPSVSFFDGATARTFATLGFSAEAEMAFLRQARLGGFRVALCARAGTPIAPDMAAMLDFVLRHDGPGRPLAIEAPASEAVPLG